LLKTFYVFLCSFTVYYSICIINDVDSTMRNRRRIMELNRRTASRKRLTTLRMSHLTAPSLILMRRILQVNWLYLRCCICLSNDRNNNNYCYHYSLKWMLVADSDPRVRRHSSYQPPADPLSVTQRSLWLLHAGMGTRCKNSRPRRSPPETETLASPDETLKFPDETETRRL